MNNSVGGSNTTGSESNQGSTVITLNDDKIESLRAAGYTDEQIEALMLLADPSDQGSSVTLSDFTSINKQTLNSLRYTGSFDEMTKNLIYTQVPVSLMQEISNPVNWNGDNYIGSGASEVNLFLTGRPVDFTKPSLDAMIMAVLTARADIIQKQLEEQIQAITAKNDLLEQANDMLAKLNQRRVQRRQAIILRWIMTWLIFGCQ